MMNRISCYFLLMMTFWSCNEKSHVHGLTAFEKIDSVGDFARELWIEGNTFKGSFSDNYKTFYFFRKISPGVKKYVPYTSNYANGKWQEPYISDYYNPDYSYTYQLKVPQSNEIIFISNLKTKTDTTQNPNYNFWLTSWNEGKYTTPIEFDYENLIYNYNSQPCISNNGTIYFTSDLPDWSQTFSYKMSITNYKYAEPELFGPVNHWRKNMDWSVYEFCVSPDESYMIVTIENKKEAKSSADLYLSYFKDDQWTLPVKLDHGINTTEQENFPSITNDGKYLIFTRAFSEFKIISTKLFE